MESDFKHEFNNEGNWCPALALDVHDANNASFVYFDGAGVHFTTDIAEYVPRGDDAGEFRDKA